MLTDKLVAQHAETRKVASQKLMAEQVNTQMETEHREADRQS
jgi:hypothetical protein